MKIAACLDSTGIVCSLGMAGEREIEREREEERERERERGGREGERQRVLQLPDLFLLISFNSFNTCLHKLYISWWMA